jgi:hypothetical protein
MSEEPEDIFAGGNINIAEAFRTGAPGYVWEFSEDHPTWLQTDSAREGQVRWYLTQRQGGEGDDPAYHIEVPPSVQGAMEVLVHVASKKIGSREQLLEAMLPALRAVLGW